MARRFDNGSGGAGIPVVQASAARRVCAAGCRIYSRNACGVLALAAFLAIRPCLAAGDLDLKPIPDQSHLVGRLGAVGIVMVGEPERIHSMGTGFLVSACHVLAAGHVLANTEESIRVGLLAQFVPTMGNVATSLANRAVWGKVVAAGENFSTNNAAAKFDMQNAARDWALIELDRPLRNIEPYKLLYPGAAVAPDMLLSAVGYTANQRMLAIHIHDDCSIRKDFHGDNGLPGILIANCAVRSGMSGGPLLIDDGTQLIAAGIVVERIEVGDKVVAVAVSTRSFADKIAPAMRSSGVCAAGQPFALPSKDYRRHDMPARQ